MKIEEYVQAERIVRNITRLESAILSVNEEMKILKAVDMTDRESVLVAIERSSPFFMYHNSAAWTFSPDGLVNLISILTRQLTEILSALSIELSLAEKELDEIGRIN